MSKAAHSLAASDTPNDKFEYVMVTTTGDLVVNQVGGNQITITDCPANIWMPVGNATNIHTDSTASGFIVVLG